MLRKLIFAGFSVLASCAPLSAHQPLFRAENATAPKPLQEGVWGQATDQCKPDPAEHRTPDGCSSLEVSQSADGAWQLRVTPERGPAVRYQRAQDQEWRFVMSPAVSRETGRGGSPLYIAEYSAADDPTILYAAIVPIGALPAREILLLPIIECEDALHDGPIAGVLDLRGSGQRVRVCYADSQQAVREAARRAVIERLGDLASTTSATRLVYLHPAQAHPSPRTVLTVSAQR